MMPFPSRTPEVVRQAIGRYLRARKLIACATAVAAGLAAGGFVILICLVTDRFIEYDAAWRAWGLRAAVLLAFLGVIGAVMAFLRRVPIFPAAVRLDQALPANQDRWATSLDLAGRLETGENVGDPSLVNRLFAETESLTSGTQVTRLISRRGLSLAAGCLAVVATALATLHVVGTFDMPLLWRRLVMPYGNWPRDSFTAIRILEINGKPFPAGTRALDALPEESPFAVRIAVGRKAAGNGGAADEPWIATPRLEIRDTDGRQRSVEFVASGRQWVLAWRSLDRPISFRIRAGDGLTEFFRQPVIPRIRLRSLEHSVRYPGYSRIPPVKRQPLESERLGVMEGAQLEFFLSCDAPAKELQASFEVLQRKQEQETPKGLAAWHARERGEEVTGKEQAPAVERRVLKVTRTREDAGRFSLLADESGILRMEAVGTNNLPSRERVVFVEAVRDTPPRVSLAGMERDTWVVPGEVVGFEYTAEDDLGVSDLIMEWGVAGGAKSEILSGEEYINSDQFGRKTVTGRELIQRMNYYVYAQAPFEFKVVAIDTKGQEARTDQYRIHLIADDFASRYEEGMVLLAGVEEAAASIASACERASNQLNIIAAATQGVEKWAGAQDPLLEGLLDSLRRDERYRLMLFRGRHEFGDIPDRLDRSLALLLAAERLLPSVADNRDAVLALRTGASVSASIASLRADLAAQKEYARIWQAAAAAERRRFGAELCLQSAMKLANRLGTLEVGAGDQRVRDANVAFYASQATNLVKECARIAGPPPALTAAMDHLKPAIGSLDAAGLHTALREVAQALSDRPALASPELGALAAKMADLASKSAVDGGRFQMAVADVLKLQGGASVCRPLDQLRLARAWMQDGVKGDPPWFAKPASAGDLWLVAAQVREMVRSHRLDVRAGRYDLDPARRQDVEGELRENALGFLEMLATGEGLDESQKQALLQPMTAVVRGTASDGADPFAAVPFDGAQGKPAAAEKVGRAQVASLGNQLKEDFTRLAVTMDAMGGKYTAFAASLAAEVGRSPAESTNSVARAESFRSEALQLLAGMEAMECIYRNLLYLQLECSFLEGQNRAWEAWQPFHGIQLAITVAALNAREQVSFRLISEDGKTQALAVDGARKVAVDLGLYAGLLRKAAQGENVVHDFTALVKESRTIGHLEALQAEYEFIRPGLRPGDPAGLATVRDKVSAAPLGRLAINERVLDAALALQEACAASNAAPASLAPRLSEMAAALGARGEAAPPEALGAFRQKLEAPGLPPALSSVPGFKDFQGAMAKEVDSLRMAVRLPPTKGAPRQNLRDRQMMTLGLWVISDTFRRHDQRWTTRLRDAELALTRDLVAAAIPPFVLADAADRLALDYARMVELRARQLAGERRRNQGISFLEGYAGPRLKLPKHIADEFLRARNRKSPEQFKEYSEGYYEALYRDLGR